MPYSSPQSAESITELVGLDRVLNDLVEQFNKIEWLESKVFRRAYIDTFPNTQGDDETSPMVYMGLGEYYDPSINDHMPCSAFFQAKGPERIGFTKPRDFKSITNTRPIALVFWANLEALSESFSGDYIYTEHIKTLFLQTLAQNTHVISIEQAIDEPMQEVFDGFTFAENRQYNKHPFSGVRINFTVQYTTAVKPC